MPDQRSSRRSTVEEDVAAALRELRNAQTGGSGRAAPAQQAAPRSRAVGAGAAQPRQADREAAARADADRRSAARQAPAVFANVIPGGAGTQLIARPFIDTIVDPELRGEAARSIGENAQRAWNTASNYVGSGQALRDAGRAIHAFEDVRSGRAGARAAAAIADYATSRRARDDVARSGRAAENVARRAGDVARDAGAYLSGSQARRDAASLGRSIASGEMARDAAEYVASGRAGRDLGRVADAAKPALAIARDLTYGPWEDHERQLWSRDYRRAMGDEAGAQRAAREANRATLRAGVNATAAIPIGGGAGLGARASVAAATRKGGAELAERALRGFAPATREQAAARAATGRAEGARSVVRSAPDEVAARGATRIERPSPPVTPPVRGVRPAPASSARQGVQTMAPRHSGATTGEMRIESRRVAQRPVRSFPAEARRAPSLADNARERAAVLEDALARMGVAPKGAQRRSLARPIAAGGLSALAMAGDAAAQEPGQTWQ